MIEITYLNGNVRTIENSFVIDPKVFGESVLRQLTTDGWLSIVTKNEMLIASADDILSIEYRRDDK